MTIPHAHRDAPTRPDPTLDHIFCLVADLIDVIEDENRLLARGIPASMTDTAQSKTRLALELDRVLADAVTCRKIAAADLEQRAVLVERIGHVESAISENVTRLAAAIQATRRRIGAVLGAIREQVAAESHVYTGCGRLPSHVPHGSMSRGRLA